MIRFNKIVIVIWKAPVPNRCLIHETFLRSNCVEPVLKTSHSSTKLLPNPSKYTHTLWKGRGAVCDYMILQRLTMNICKREDLVKRLTFSLPKLPLPPPPIWIGNNKIMFICARTCPLHCAVCTVSVVEDMREVKLRRLLWTALVSPKRNMIKVIQRTWKEIRLIKLGRDWPQAASGLFYICHFFISFISLCSWQHLVIPPLLFAMSIHYSFHVFWWNLWKHHILVKIRIWWENVVKIQKMVREKQK